MVAYKTLLTVSTLINYQKINIKLPWMDT